MSHDALLELVDVIVYLTKYSAVNIIKVILTEEIDENNTNNRHYIFRKKNFVYTSHIEVRVEASDTSSCNSVAPILKHSLYHYDFYEFFLTCDGGVYHVVI